MYHECETRPLLPSSNKTEKLTEPHSDEAIVGVTDISEHQGIQAGFFFSHANRFRLYNKASAM